MANAIPLIQRPVALPSSRAVEEPLADRAYRQLRADILAGRIEPGTKLKLDILQKGYGFSNTPLREALSRLAAERIVLSDERRGFRASPVSSQDFKDLTQLRLTVECGAFADSIRNGDDVWEAGVVAALHRLSIVQGRVPRAARLGSDEWALRHKDFHMSLIAACASRRMVAIATEAFDQAGRYRLISSRHRYRPRDAHDEHQELAKLALARKEQAATLLLRTHISKTSDSVLTALQEAEA